MGNKKRKAADKKIVYERSSTVAGSREGSALCTEQSGNTDATSGSPPTKRMSIFRADTFTFFVGPEKVRFIAHKDALTSISKPLTRMMTNGNMMESLQDAAYLEDIDPAVFEEFLGYAYNGVCGLKSGVHTHDTVAISSLRFRCHSCGRSLNVNENITYPFCSAACRANAENAAKQYYSHGDQGLWCIYPDCSNTVSTKLDGITSASILCGHHDTSKNRAKLCDDRSQNAVTIGRIPWKSTQFACQEYGSREHTHTELKSLFEILSKVSRPLPDIRFHAQLYVLADKYMVFELKDIALHKLHYDLVALAITEKNVDSLIDLILYVYSNTSDEGDILNGDSDRLRDLVMAYMVAKSKQVIKYQAFRQMLSAGGTQAADFMALGLEQMAR